MHQSTKALSNDIIHEKTKRSQLPPFKIIFEHQQQPPENQVLNELVKHNDRLNINTAFILNIHK